MALEPILSNIGKHISLQPEETAFFTSLLQYREISKKEHLLKEGQFCRTISYVESGALRAFHCSPEGKDSTIMFAIADWWITDMYAFATEQPAMQNIVAIDDSRIWQLRKEDLECLYTRVPKFERFFRIIMQNSYIREQLRVLQNLSLTAEERYDIFLDKYPMVVPYLAQKQIASYLGITPEFLSTVRRNKVAK
jgi:CRP-like cAMP-binding protein